MKKSLLLAFAGMMALAMVPGCKKKPEKKSSKGAAKAGAMTADPGGGPSAEEQGDRLLSRKLQPYIKMGNFLSKQVYGSRQRYMLWVKSAKDGPTCKERNIYGLYRISIMETQFKAVAKVQKAAPRLKLLEGAATKYMDAVKKLKPLTQKAKRYYEQKDYKEDKCKVGKELHPKLVALWTQFEAADKIMGQQIEKLNLDLHYRLLARFAKKYGKTSPRYYHKKIPLDARVLLHLLKANARAKKPDHDKIAAAVKKFDALAVEMGEKAGKGGKAKLPDGFNWFKSAANDYAKACKEMMRRLKEGKKWSATEKRHLSSQNGWLVEGSYPKVRKKFNELIDKTNRVRFRR